MKKRLKYLYVIWMFILIDAFIRGLIPNLRRLLINENYEFWRILAFQMLYFILFQSWFYYPIAALFYGVSLLLKFDRFYFIFFGSIVAYSHYIFYCLTSGDSFGSEVFYIRSVQYILFGGYFGFFRYQMMLKANESKELYTKL